MLTKLTEEGSVNTHDRCPREGEVKTLRQGVQGSGSLGQDSCQ